MGVIIILQMWSIPYNSCGMVSRGVGMTTPTLSACISTFSFRSKKCGRKSFRRCHGSTAMKRLDYFTGSLYIMTRGQRILETKTTRLRVRKNAIGKHARCNTSPQHRENYTPHIVSHYRHASIEHNFFAAQGRCNVTTLRDASFFCC